MSKQQINHCIVAEFNSLEILREVIANTGTRIFTIGEHAYHVKQSPRYAMFVNNPSCVGCGITGTVVRMEYFKGNSPKTAHFNFYAKNEMGGLILMTKDHIIPGSVGGPTLPWNLQTMCTNCNQKKGNILPFAFPNIPEEFIDDIRKRVHKKIKVINSEFESLLLMHYLLNSDVREKFKKYEIAYTGITPNDRRVGLGEDDLCQESSCI